MAKNLCGLLRRIFAIYYLIFALKLTCPLLALCCLASLVWCLNLSATRCTLTLRHRPCRHRLLLMSGAPPLEVA